MTESLESRTGQDEGREAASHEASAEVERKVLETLVPLLRDAVLGRNLLLVAHRERGRECSSSLLLLLSVRRLSSREGEWERRSGYFYWRRLDII